MKKSFPARLRQLRGCSSQADFARKIGTKQTTYSSWERGEKEPSLSTIGVICQLFHVTSDWLLCISSSQAPPQLNVNNGSAANHSPGAYVVNENGHTQECQACTAKDKEIAFLRQTVTLQAEAMKGKTP